MNNRNKIKYAIIIFIVILYSGCQDKRLPTIFLNKEKSTNSVSDSMQLFQVECLVAHNKSIYFSNISYDQIINLDEDFSLINIIGKKGKRENELLEINQFAMHDSLICVLNNGNNRINIYNITGELLEEHPLSNIDIRFSTRYRFEFNHKEIIGCSSLADTPLTVYNIYNNEQLFFGEKYEFPITDQTAIRNDRLTCIFENKLIVVSDNVPNIEVYDLDSKEILFKYDYSEITEIKSSLDEIEKKELKNKSTNSYYSLCQDIYINNRYLYLLLVDYTKSYNVNQIIRFELTPNIKPISIMKLPGELYSSFCISDSFIYAYNTGENSIERFTLPF